MSFQTGTIANINDVLDVLATFLTANGWTIDGNWLEPVFVRNQAVAPVPPNPMERWWRYARRIHAHKGGLYISAQDFWYTYDFSYGTINNFGLVGSLQGPGISMIISTGLNGTSPGVTGGHPLNGYDAGGPANPNFYTQPGIPVNSAGTARTMIMPLPQLTDQPLGRWYAGTHVMDATSPLSNPGGNPLLPAPFGIPGGAAVPMKYWLMSDVSGTNIFMIIDRTGVDYDTVAITPYLYFGDMSAEKGGVWTGGYYAGATHGCSSVWTLVLNEYHHCTRFGPPGAQRDNGSCATILRADIDAYSGYLGLGNNDLTTGPGRNFASTTVLDPKPTDFNQNPLGILDPGILPMILRRRNSSMAPGPPCLPTYWLAQRDNGLWSMLGSLRDVYQTRQRGISIGSAAPAGADDLIYFDGFAIRRHP